MKYFIEMTTAGISPNSRTVRYLMQNTENGHNHTLLAEIVRLLTPKHGQSRAFAILLRALQETGNEKGSDWVLQQVREVNPEPTSELLSELIQWNAKHHHPDDCVRLLKQWLSNKTLSLQSTEFQAALLSAAQCCRETSTFQGIRDLLEIMSLRSVPFDDGVLYHLMFADIRPLVVSQVEQLYNLCRAVIRAHEANFAKDGGSWRLLIRRFQLLDRRDLAYELAQEMERLGCQPQGINSFNAVLSPVTSPQPTQ